MSNVLQQIDMQMKLLKNLGFDVTPTDEFKDMLKAGFLYRSCSTHDINYPYHSHIANYCCLWKKDDKEYKYAIRLCVSDLPEETIRELELLGYTRNTHAVIYEGIGDAC